MENEDYFEIMRNFISGDNNGFRNDLELISSWIKPNSKVLDLGCGDGYLLKMLAEKKISKVWELIMI